jgi:hypothetical protein
MTYQTRAAKGDKKSQLAGETYGEYLDPEIERDRALAVRAVAVLRAQCAAKKAGGGEVSMQTPLGQISHAVHDMHKMIMASTKKGLSPKQRAVMLKVLGLTELPPLIAGEHPLDVMVANRPLKPPGKK